GVGLAALLLARGLRERRARERDPLASLASAAVLALTAFFAWTLLPTGVMNMHDDFQTYLPRLVRVLAAGTVGGNAFDALGADGLGTQALFQALALTFLPL